MKSPQKIIVYGSAVAMQCEDFAPAAVLLRGVSGRGKSDLSFRLIEAGGMLICDDQVVLEIRHEKIITADSVEPIRGLMEVRGVGLLKFPVASPTQLRLVVDLVLREEVPRLPEWETEDILGIPIVRLKLCAFEESAPLKIAKAIELVHKPSLLI